MSSKKRKAVNGALLSAAVTALTVKGTLASPVGVLASAPLNDLKKGLGEARNATLANSEPLLDRTQSRLQDAVLGIGNQRPEPSPPSAAAPSYRRPDQASDRARVHKILEDAARRHGIDPRLVLALAYWESGWDQTRVSGTGAVGLMQVEPATAQTAGPALLGRSVDITDPYDNADVGVAVFKEDLDNFKSPAMALAAYYQGPTSLEQNGMLMDTRQYVEGILNLVSRMSP